MAASASVADTSSLVTVRWGPSELVGWCHCVTCWQDTEIGVAAPMSGGPIAAQGAGSSDQIVAAGESVVRSAGCPCSKSDSTLWCHGAARGF